MIHGQNPLFRGPTQPIGQIFFRLIMRCHVSLVNDFLYHRFLQELRLDLQWEQGRELDRPCQRARVCSANFLGRVRYAGRRASHLSREFDGARSRAIEAAIGMWVDLASSFLPLPSCLFLLASSLGIGLAVGRLGTQLSRSNGQFSGISTCIASCGRATQAAQLKPPGIAEAVGEGFGRPVGVCEDPVDFAGEGAVENAGVVRADSEVDV